MAQPLKSCRTCQFLDVALNAAEKRVIRKDTAYPCIAPLPEIRGLPEAITTSYGYTPLDKQRRRCMEPSEGTTCPTWELFKAAKTA